MKYIGLQLAANAASIILAIGSVVMALRNIDGWWWMMVASLLAAGFVTWDDKDKQP